MTPEQAGDANLGAPANYVDNAATSVAAVARCFSGLDPLVVELLRARSAGGGAVCVRGASGVG